MSNPRIAYKGFDSNWQCRGYQYEVGGVYAHNGKVEVCNSGFHVCELPMDCFTYFPPGSSKYAEVVVSGEISSSATDTKLAAGNLVVTVEIDLATMIERSVEWIKNAAGSSGDYSKLAASGNDSKLAASGYGSNLAASGHYSKLAASGDDSKLAASGNYSKLAASGNYSKLAASGDGAIALGSYGCRAKIGKNGAIAIAWEDANNRPRIAVAYEGDGIKRDTWYRVDETGTFIECED